MGAEMALGIAFMRRPAHRVGLIIGGNLLMNRWKIQLLCQEIGEGPVDEAPGSLCACARRTEKAPPRLEYPLADFVGLPLGVVGQPSDVDRFAGRAEKAQHRTVQTAPV